MGVEKESVQQYIERVVEYLSGEFSMEKINPPIKYVGGKRWLVPELLDIYSKYRDRTLYEPFVGGMSVALGLRPEHARLFDINYHLVNFYRHLKQGFDPTLAMVNEEENYYRYRTDFNGLIECCQWNSFESAELFYYLSKTGFNGLMRYNKAGYHNVPFGRYKTVGYQTDFSAYKIALANWDISQGHFREFAPEPGDFVYLDPPYDSDEGDAFVDYSSDGFTWAEQIELAKKFATHDGPVVASNKATHRIVDLYQQLGYNVSFVDAPRRVSANGNRQPVQEMIATKNIVRK